MQQFLSAAWFALTPECPALYALIGSGCCLVHSFYDGCHIGTDNGPVDRGEGNDGNLAALNALLQPAKSPASLSAFKSRFIFNGKDPVPHLN